MKDRTVQYPNRYRLTPVGGASDTYDLTAVPGTVTEPGTVLNKANLLTDETATALGLTGDPSVNDAIAKLINETIAVTLPTTGYSITEPYSITIAASGVKSDSLLIISPAPAYFMAYAECVARCTAQGENTLTFVVESIPESAITVNVAILG